MAHKALILGNVREESALLSLLEKTRFETVRWSAEKDEPLLAYLKTKKPALLMAAAQDISDDTDQLLQVRAEHDCEVVLIGDHVTQAQFTGLVEQGAAMYLRTPLNESFVTELLKDIYQDAVAASRRGRRRQQPVAMDQFGPIYGSSSSMREMYRFLRKAAVSEAVLCIHGESGTGKELVAKAVHAYSAHGDQPFEAINCAAIPTELVESELFGHEKGSFSGAVSEHLGIFERVGAGTLLLDEITEMPHNIQVKLLRVLESGQFRRVGGEVDLSYQARVIAATNRKPYEAVLGGHLREDLFYRLSQLEVRVPSLRERGQDIIDLSRLFVARFDEENDRRLTLGTDAERVLLNYHWPGNVRQLWNVIQKACTTARREIRAADLPLEDHATPTQADIDCVEVPVDASLRESEELLIKASMERHEGNKQRVADQLGISLRTLYARLDRYART